MSDFVEWNPKRHGQKPPYWLPDMLTSVDGKNFARQPNWAWIAGSTYYVPREAVELPRIEPEPEQAGFSPPSDVQHQRDLQDELTLSAYAKGYWQGVHDRGCDCHHKDAVSEGHQDWLVNEAQAIRQAALEKQP